VTNTPSGSKLSRISHLQTAALVGLVAIASYLAPTLAGALMLNPRMAWPLWPGCALLVSMLLLFPRRTWVALIPTGFAAFILYDLQAGVPLISIAWFVAADTVQVLITLFCLTRFFDGLPQLNSVSSLTKYLFSAVFLAPFAAAFVSAPGIRNGYWNGWRICFLSEVLAFLTLPPTILSYASNRHAWIRKSRAFYLEGIALIIGLVLLGYFSLTTSVMSSLPVLLYSLVPLLLWAALRFGTAGISSASIIIAFLTIWGAVHGRGPFVEKGPLSGLVSIQLFLVLTVTPFMVLAALAEERTNAAEGLKIREEDLIQAQRVAQVGSWRWDPVTDQTTWSKELYRIVGLDPHLPAPAFAEQSHVYTTESWQRLKCTVSEAIRTGTPYQLDLEIIRPDGSTRWITDRGEALRDAAGRIALLRGTAQDITERKRSEVALRESEEKFRSVFRDAGVGMVIVSPEGRFLAANQSFCECLGYSEEELVQKTVQSITLEEDWPSFSKNLSDLLERGLSFKRIENHCVHKSGRIVNTECSAFLIRGRGGEPRYFVGEVLDITQRKLADETLLNASRKLIEAHEEERTWIARELHDDFVQRIALLAINLENLRQEVPASENEARQEIQNVLEYVADFGSDIQALSHRLHSSKLEYLGIVAASKSFCREFSDRQKVKIDFQVESLPKTLSKEVSLCLFRVMQEALQNAVKHSGTRRFEVSLKAEVDEIDLTVHDSGVGFDPENAINGHGLGITSMKERLKLIDGQLSIESQPQQGTTIRARVPLGIKKSASTGRQVNHSH
jgi:PAS domain S-box-containing protein